MEGSCTGVWLGPKCDVCAFAIKLGVSRLVPLFACSFFVRQGKGGLVEVICWQNRTQKQWIGKTTFIQGVYLMYVIIKRLKTCFKAKKNLDKLWFKMAQFFKLLESLWCWYWQAASCCIFNLHHTVVLMLHVGVCRILLNVWSLQTVDMRLDGIQIILS